MMALQRPMASLIIALVCMISWVSGQDLGATKLNVRGRLLRRGNDGFDGDATKDVEKTKRQLRARRSRQSKPESDSASSIYMSESSDDRGTVDSSSKPSSISRKQSNFSGLEGKDQGTILMKAFM